ncbi:MAG: hypothetical protein SGILL_001893 [Bacillariaceae sp.]
MTALGMIHVSEILPGAEAETNNKSSSSSISADAPADFLHAPETALGIIHFQELESRSENPQDVVAALNLSDPLVAAAPDTATGNMSILEFLDDDMKAQLQHYLEAKEALPTTLEEAMQDERPIVITNAKAPFEVYDVNAAWEGLCGYSRAEAQHRSVGDLLQGPATDGKLATDLIRALQTTGFAEGTLTNYKKDGSEFTNTLQLGKVVRDSTAVHSSDEVYFVGILHDDAAVAITSKKAAM